MKYRFGRFLLDPETFELCEDGKLIALEPQVFAIIKLLIANRHRMVSKSEMMDVVWGGRIVSEGAVSSRIRSARLALGDTGKLQSVIRTVHGQGLRFIADVEELDDPGKDHLVPDAAKNTARTRFDLPDARDKPSIAVLPFESFAQTSNEVVFAKGLTEETISNLARFRDLFVFSRLTTTKLINDGAGVTDLSQRLGADFVMEGSVRLTAATTRVKVQLLDAVTGLSVLAEQFEREASPDSLYEIQDQIALLVAGRVADRYGPIGKFITRHDRGAQFTKWDTYLQIARFYDYYETRDRKLHADVKAGLEAATAEDRGSSDAWAALALLYVDEYRLPFHDPPKPDLLDRALTYAEKSVSFDRENSFAYLARALTRFHRKELDDFHVAAEKCVSLNPGHAHNLAEIAFCYCLISDFDRAVPLADRAVELSPVHPGWFRLTRACDYFVSGDPRAAIAEQKKTPMEGYFWYHAYMVAYSALAGDMELTRAEVATIKALYPDFATRIFTEAEVWCVAGKMPLLMLEGWRKAGLEVFFPEKYSHLS
ncbi:winged helix-turn-helix domain-containing protein [Ruegeria sp. 2205SS24-7]|uniref:winged helix-turn-helix domain-containing protein n=1 Tax=Ruegeria discodermiae TaxID=3064389 RepID=UPI00274276A0|nr:winged helix-turn-helix domain-containing protein [Ruegeria sp. 2205SS24-7]MDP5218768.1 winged helix-turn-helix domain-containing protein [Ruegeria sp. 2205SS24-7]